MTVTNGPGGPPLANAPVYVTVDAYGDVPVGDGTVALTGLDGRAVLALVPGSVYWLWGGLPGRHLPGVQFVASTAGATVATSDAAEPERPGYAGRVTATLQLASAGVAVTFQQRSDPAGEPCQPQPFTVASADDGSVAVQLVAGARYSCRVGPAGLVRLFTVPPSGPTFAIA